MNDTTTRTRLLDPVAARIALAEIAAADAAHTEHDRNLTPAVADALVASALAGLIAPVELGGHAAEPAVLVDTLAAVSAADASTGWCLAIGMGVNHLAGYLPRDGAAALFRDVARPGCAVFAPTGRATACTAGTS